MPVLTARDIVQQPGHQEVLHGVSLATSLLHKPEPGGLTPVRPALPGPRRDRSRWTE